MPNDHPLAAVNDSFNAVFVEGDAVGFVEGTFELPNHLTGDGGPGNRFLLDTDRVTAGRHPDSEIFLDDVTVSRRHAVFDRDGSSFTVSDVGSLNGTYVNRDRIDTVRLKDGDEVQVGKYRLVFFSGHEGA